MERQGQSSRQPSKLPCKDYVRPTSSTSEDTYQPIVFSSPYSGQSESFEEPLQAIYRDIVMILTKKMRHILFLMIMTSV